MEIQPTEAILTLPDGREAHLPILKGTEGPSVIDIRTLHSQTGLYTIDPGFTTTSSCVSSITYLDGDQGQLWYRGYPIQDLAQHCSFLQVCYLLLYGQLPSSAQLSRFQQAVSEQMCIHHRLLEFYSGFQQGAHPMAIMVGVVGALSAFLHQSNQNYTTFPEREAVAIKLIAKFPMIAAVAYRTAYGLPIVYPKKNYSYVQNFLYMMFDDPMSDQFDMNSLIIQALEKIFILHADHEQNASTSTVRIAGSSLANPFACIAGGIASLWGPMHGGANQAVLEMLDQIQEGGTIQEFIQKAKDPKDSFRLMGFGHRVYKNYDPRCRIISNIAHRLLEDIGAKQIQLFGIASELQKQALQDEYFVKRKLFPNVDFYSGVVLEAIGIPRDMFTVIFALARCIGWISQWNEMMSETPIRIGRPRQLYTGMLKREIMEIEDRGEDIRLCRRESVKRVWSPQKKVKQQQQRWDIQQAISS